MRRCFSLLAVATMMLALGHTAQAAEKAELNKPVPDFTLNDVVTGEAWSLSDNKGAITVLVFQSIQCPWDYMRLEAGYQRVLSPMSQAYADRNVRFVAINSNATESIEDVAAYVKRVNMPYPIVKDPGNKVADMFDAKTTPHIYIVDAEGVLVYRGGIEAPPSNPRQCGQMQEQYLKPVLDALIAGEELPFTDTVSKGCTIKRAR